MKLTRLASLAALATLIGACSSTPEQPVVTSVAPSSTAAAAPLLPGLLPPGPALPNPYLQSQSAVTVSPEVARVFAAATRAMEQQQWARAEPLLQGLAAQNAHLSGVWLNLGFVYRAQGDNQRAEQAFNQAIAANHTNLDAYNALAILQREAGDFAAAESNYLKALSIWPWHADSQKNLGILYDLYMDRGADALAHYQAYQTLVGDSDKTINSWIADLQRRLGVSPKAAPPEVESNGGGTQ